MKTQEEVVRQHAVGPISIYKIYQEGYQDRELDDWDAFRREAAKDILCSMVRGGYDWGRGAEQARLAVSYAEELIKALKEEKA